MRSGTTSQCWKPNGLPVRPKPVSTSSATSSAPSASHAARTSGQYSGGGTSTPFAPGTGSRNTAAIDRGPSSAIDVADVRRALALAGLDALAERTAIAVAVLHVDHARRAPGSSGGRRQSPVSASAPIDAP